MNKIILLSLALLAAPISTYAQCFGTDSFSSCNDNAGNHYNVSRFGNTTTVHGNNSRTGNNWNQTTTTYGNQTITNGRAANGNSWNQTRTEYGNGNYSVSGRNAQGQNYHKTCNQFGCY